MPEVKSLTVVIPCYNAAPFLRECLDSVFNQTHPPDEVILVNDGSTDSSHQIAASYGEKIKIISQENQGVSAARNRGILEATSDWVAIQDADDIWHPEKLEKQVRALAMSREPIVCCYTDFYLFGKDLSIPHFERPELHVKEDAFVFMLADWSVTSNAALFKKEIAQKFLFPLGVQDNEDTIFFALLRREGKFLRVPEPLAGYRKGPHQRTALKEHELLGIQSTLLWAHQNSGVFSKKEKKIFLKLMEERLRRFYMDALKAYRWSHVKACRRIFKDQFQGNGFEWPVFYKDLLTFGMGAKIKPFTNLLKVGK